MKLELQPFLLLLLPCLTILPSAAQSCVLGCGPLIPRGCEGGQCASLYLHTNTGEQLEVKGTHEKVKLKNVEQARVVGEGCFVIYKGKGFAGSSFKVDGTTTGVLGDAGHTWTTVKSVEYSPTCTFSRRAGAEVFVLAGAAVVVLLMGAAMLVWARMKRKRHQLVRTTEEQIL